MSSRFGLAAGHQYHVPRLFVQAKGNGIVGGGVAGVQGGHDIHLLGQVSRVGRCFGAECQKTHARKAQPLRQCG